MEKFIDNLIKDFESGKVGRREFCQTVALAASVYAMGAEANAAAPQRGFTMLGVNHLSYDCPDYRQARDFYRSTFGMQVLNDNGMNRANLAFGPAPGQGDNFIVTRTAPATPPPPTQATIDHICLSIANWDETKVRGALAARGNPNPTGRPGSWHVYDPFDYDVQIGNAVEENAFRR